ncbi:YlbF family regulator [Paenibacillus massiliensis]|uniref:YlbF family regulator n=1 Tax=Paenibacillus massiliensis TaxID=225917 RepID=UPI0004701786|nr:YlbF family regulator [Paenibacillus massiliensis]
MDVVELDSVNLTDVLIYAYELGDMINESTEVADYLYWKQRVEMNPDIAEWVRKLEQKKELFQETERFGHFHPNYHAAREEVQKVEEQLNRFEEVACFKEAEKALDKLLHEMSEMIAYSVSDTIKVPGNDPLPKGGGCGSGGKCSCG